MQRPYESSIGAPFRQTLIELAQLDKSDLEEALRRILERDAIAAGIERVSYWELGADSIRCRAQYTTSTGEVTSGGELHARDFPMYFEGLLSCRSIVAHDAWAHPQTAEFAVSYFPSNGVTSMLDVPVWRQGKLAGVLCHEHVGPMRTWTNAEHDFALGIANIISVALEERDRRRAEERHLLIGRASNDMLWDWDFATNSIEFSEGASAVFRYRPEDVEHTHAWWDARMHPDDRERIAASLTATFEAGTPAWSGQYRWYRGDGTLATILDRGCITYEGGKPRRMVGAMIDISDRLELEARLALSDRMASIGQLATGVAHEINNPLAYMLANLVAAIEDIERGVEPREIVTMLREAVEGAERVRRVVRDLQTFARPREDDREAIDVRALVESSINMTSNQLRHRAQLVKCFGDVPKVHMNRARLGQVMINLIVNAAQAIPEGAVSTNEVRVSTLVDERGQVVLEVRDTGCGFNAETRARMFDPFFTTKPVGVGTGLGLAICHSIVTAAGGSIELVSPPTGGCIARVTLPPTTVVVPRTITPTAPLGPRKRVLVVEDEERLRNALARSLRRHHDVIVVENGERALAQLTDGPQVDAIVCDLMMPNMTGMELYDRLREEQPAQAARMVFMTGGAFTQRASQFAASTSRPVLEKPVEIAVLCRAIDAVSAQAG